jgi:hypothetical protein
MLTFRYGSVLSVEPVSCRDSAGQPYEITLNLTRDSVPFAAVGQRCGYELARLAERVNAARTDPVQAAAWPDPDDRFPVPGIADEADASADLPQPPRGSALFAGGGGGGYTPGDHEYFALRSRDRGDPPGSGELRCVLRSSAIWLGECTGVGLRTLHQRVAQRSAVRPPASGHGSWQLTRRAVIEAWGSGGLGVRAVLTSAELMAFLDTVVTGLAAIAATDDPSAREAPAVHQPAGKEPGDAPMSRWRQRGRVPDAFPQSRLPAVRASAGSGSLAASDTAPRWGDVRR